MNTSIIVTIWDEQIVLTPQKAWLLAWKEARLCNRFAMAGQSYPLHEWFESDPNLMRLLGEALFVLDKR